VKSYGGLIEWKPSINYQSNTVYYWRVQSTDSQVDEWNGSSFVYYPEKGVGWNQSHYYQQQDLTYNGLDLLESRVMDFSKVPREHKVTNQSRQANAWPAYYLDSDLIEINYDTELFSPDIVSGVYVVVIDPETSEPWSLASGGDESCAISPPGILGGRDRKAWPFTLRNANLRNCFLNFIEDEIPDGHYVMIYTIQSSAYDYSAADWAGDEAIFGRSVTSVLESHGATEVGRLADKEVPYIFAYQKGVGPVAEVIANDPGDIITAQVLVDGKGSGGKVASTLIGPAAKWETLEWEPLETNGNDTQSITIYGVNDAGEKTVLVENLTDYSANLSNVNATDYPYLELEYHVDDVTDLTAASLDYWRIYYVPLPEAVINANGDNYAFNSPILTKGELLTLDYNVSNISETDMSEMLVSYSIVGESNEAISWNQRYDVLPNNTNATYGIEYNTADLPSGTYDLQVSINPNEDQPELYFFNNVGILKFEIAGNDLNPLLDVTFDGSRIGNGDIVSPTPDIQVVLTEDNLYSLLEDPELFTLVLTHPDGTVEFVDVLGPDVEFIPAVAGGESNQATLIYTPTLPAGDYTPVQTVTQDDFQLPVGRDRTFYTWDGTDSSGNVLPNGVYYYRLFIDKDESILFDKNFAKGQGKLIIVR